MDPPGSENVIKIHLIKSRYDGFGFDICRGGKCWLGPSYPQVTSLWPGGIAERTGLVHVGDAVLALDGIDLADRGADEVRQIFNAVSDDSQATITLHGPEGYLTYLETVTEEGCLKDVRINMPLVDAPGDDVIPASQSPPRSPRRKTCRRTYGTTQGASSHVPREAWAQTNGTSGENTIIYNGRLNEEHCLPNGQSIIAGANQNHSRAGDNRKIKAQQKNNKKNFSLANFFTRTIKSQCDLYATINGPALNKTAVAQSHQHQSNKHSLHRSSETGQQGSTSANMCDIKSGKVQYDNKPIIQCSNDSGRSGNKARCKEIRETRFNDLTINEKSDIRMATQNHTSGSAITSGRTRVESDSSPRSQQGVTAWEYHSTGTKVDSPSHTESPATSPICPVSRIARPQQVRYLVNGDVKVDILHNKAVLYDTRCTGDRCMGSLMQNAGNPGIPRPKEELTAQAVDFINQFYQSIKRISTPSYQKRLNEVIAAIDERGTYDLTTAELTFGAKTAWRNAARCIGRIQWSKLQVFDARHIRTARGMFEAICNHIKFGTNKGNIRSAITVFPPRSEIGHDYRVWNPMMIGYAGYKQPDGSIIGDPAHLDITEICRKMGWRSEGGRFDVLPLVLQADGMDPEMFIIPDESILRIRLMHPDYPWFEELGLEWYAVPGVSNIKLDCGGLEFTGIPFNGWYMGPEIGARDLCDPNRYNITKTVATKMGLDTRTNATLWKDRAMVEVNVAVIHSYQKAGVTLVDHHTAAETFMKHFENEFRLRGGCPGDWVWVVPPIGGSLTPVFHQEMLNYKLKPSYEYQEPAWKRHIWKKDDNAVVSRHSGKKHKFKDIARVIMFSSKMMRSALAKRIKCTIVYATETGNSERYAKTLCEVFKTAFDAKAVQMDEYDCVELEHEALLLIVTSTFGNGDPPDNGKEFAKELDALKNPSDYATLNRSISFVQQTSQELDATQTTATGVKPKSLKTMPLSMNSTSFEPLGNVRFSVFALGSTAYPNFCAFGKYVDCTMADLGAERIQAMAEGDELCGPEQAFNDWSKKTFKASCEAFCIDDQYGMDHFSVTLTKNDNSWAPGKFRVTKVGEAPLSLCDALSLVHNKKVQMSKLTSMAQLQKAESDRQTILVRVNTWGSTQMTFVPGDHLAIFPCNRQEIVDVILSRLAADFDPEQPIKIEIQKEKTTALGAMKYWSEIDRMPFVTTMRIALAQFLDITTPPTTALLTQFANLATEKEDRDKLNALLTDSRAYDEWRYEKRPTLADVLREFPSINVVPTLLVSQLPLLQPRYYSISSSPDTYPDEIHATVAVVQYRSNNGEGDLRYGVCSTWLSSIEPGQAIPCLVRNATQFHMPEHSAVPLIMVGPGTGVAPFRAFWQQRSVDKLKCPTEDFGSMSLYFGCRRSDTDDIYKSEKMNMIDAGVLVDVPTVLSREPGVPKAYVQDLLMDRGEEVFNDIVVQCGHLYVCGDVAMAANTRKTLEKIIERFGEMSEASAKKYVVRMREQNLFHEDIFGITLKTSDVQRRARQMAVQRRWKNIARVARILSKSPVRRTDCAV